MAIPDWAAIGGLLLGGGGIGSAVVATLKYKPEKAKLEAEAATMLSNSSLEMATRANSRADSANARVDTLSAKVDRMEEEQDAQRELLHIHGDWDRELASTAREAGITVSTPPPLFLPRKLGS